MLVTIDGSHHPSARRTIKMLQRGKNVGHALSATFKRVTAMLMSRKGVRFASKTNIATFQDKEAAIMLTYDSGADGNYLSKKDRKKAGLPILRRSTKSVGVANAGTSRGKWETELPIPELSKKAGKADSFSDFPTSLMSVGKTNDDSNVSIFTKDGVTVHKEQDVLIMCNGTPILIGVRDERGRYRIPLVQRRG